MPKKQSRHQPTAEETRRRALMMELVKELGITNASELFTAMRDMFAGTLEDMLQAELGEHLGYDRHDQTPKETQNRRNGYISKTLTSEQTGEMELRVPRDRDSSFEPRAVRKGQNDVTEIENKVMAMYAKGLSDRDISAIIEEIYGFSVSHETISKIVERVMPRFQEWQSESVDPLYAFVFIDAMFVSIKQDGKSVSKPAYSVLGVDMNGHKRVLGLWIRESEGAKYWMNIFDELRARGLKRILLAGIDGLAGLEDALLSIFPGTHIQRCMVHLVRDSVKFVPTKHNKAFCQDAKRLYASASVEQAREALGVLRENWSEYPSAVRVWERNFEHVERLYELPSDVRRVIYTTNMIEGYHSSLRRVTNGKGAFPNDDSAYKALYLRICDITKRWTAPIPNWARVLNQLAVMFPDVFGENAFP